MSKEKNVFISHSSKDADFAMHLCEIFEREEALGCWIAPRDIPYGLEWAGEITEAIKNSKVMIFIFTQNSNRSSQVVKEINIALQNDVKIISVKLDETEPNASLYYYLSNLHGLTVPNMQGDEIIGRLASRVEKYILGLGKTAEHWDDFEGSEMEGLEEGWERLLNIDEELDAKFDELFGSRAAEQNEEELNPFRRKLLDRIAERVVDIFASGEEEDEDWDDEEEPDHESWDDEEEPDHESWDDEEEPDGENWDTEEESDSVDDAKRYFTLTETEGADTMVFMVSKKILEPEYRVIFDAEQLEDELEILGNGIRRRTFYCREPDHEGNPLEVLTFMPNKNIVIINVGFMYKDIIKIGKKPMAMEYKTIEEKGSKMTIFRANEEGNYKYIIDPETCKLVPRKSYYDKKSGKRYFYMEILPYKKYFAFQLRSGENGEERIASYMEIARGYYNGRYGLKQNMLNAAEWFEKAGTPEAHYYLGLIFRNDPLLSDEEDAAYYMKLAFEGGEARAEEYLNK